MQGLLSFNTAIGFILVLTCIQVVIALYGWYLRKTKGKHEDLLAEYTVALDEQLDLGVAPIPVDFFDRDISSRARNRLLRDFLRDNCAAAPHPQIAIIRQLALDCGLVDELRREASRKAKWRKALALRLLSVVCETQDADLFRTVISKSNFKPAILAAAIGLANCNEHPELKSFISRLYNDKTPNRDEVLAIMTHHYSDSVEESLGLITDTSLPLTLRTTLIDFVGTSRSPSASTVLEDLLRNATDADMALHTVEALERTGNSDSARVILPFAAHADFRVRLKAVNALERLANETYMEEAEKLLDDENVFVRRNAAESISRMGEAGIAKLKSMTASTNINISRTAKMILAEKEFGKTRWRHKYGDAIV